MGVFDFLFGTPDQTGQLDPETKRARDFLLNQMLQQYSAGPINVPRYQAMVPKAQYAGSNALLGSLGLGQINAPQLPTTTIGGMQVATSLPLQQAMESEFAERNPAQYDFLRSFYMDPVTGELGTRSFGYTPPEEETSPEEDEANRRRRRRRRSRRNRERIAQQEQEAQRNLTKTNYGGFINCNKRGIKDFQTTWRELNPKPRDEYDVAMEEAQENKKGIY